MQNLPTNQRWLRAGHFEVEDGAHRDDLAGLDSSGGDSSAASMWSSVDRLRMPGW